MLVGSRHHSSITGIIYGHKIPLLSSVTNIGVRFDPHLTFKNHINYVWKSSFIHLMNIAQLRCTLIQPDAVKLIHAFVSIRLDYCTYWDPNKSLQRLQYTQNCVARILMRKCKYDHITPILLSLHWLTDSMRIV